MKTLLSCAYNMDNCCVELKFANGSMIAIDTIAVENEVADNLYQRSELDYLIYNDPIAKIGIPAPSACSLSTTLPEFQPHFHALKPQCLIIGLAQPYCD